MYVAIRLCYSTQLKLKSHFSNLIQVMYQADDTETISNNYKQEIQRRNKPNKRDKIELNMFPSCVLSLIDSLGLSAKYMPCAEKFEAHTTS